MHTKTLENFSHNHVFGQDRVRPAERRTLAVVVVTAAMMVVEIAAGIAYGSMALLADGLHMASHATALLISVLAYVLARRLSGDTQALLRHRQDNQPRGFCERRSSGGVRLRHGNGERVASGRPG